MKYKLVINADGSSSWVDAALAPRLRERTDEKSVHVSDIAMCCLPEEVPERVADAKLHGFHVEFHEDKRSNDLDGTVNCYNAHIPKGELNRYRKHLGLEDRNSKNGSRAMLSPEHLAQAQRLARERFPVKETA
jgi:hypothetical protein